jgi:hypothetical protein
VARYPGLGIRMAVPWFSLIALLAGGWAVWRGVGPWLADRRFRQTARDAAGTITEIRWYQRGSGTRSRMVGSSACAG